MASSGKGLMLVAFTLAVVAAQDIPVLRSCLELYRAGYKSDAEYKIDPDGPGQGLPAFPVYCDMTNEDFPAISMVYHDQMFNGVVPNGFEDAGEFRIPVVYEGGVAVDQISKLADVSMNCTQYLRVDCHHITMWYRDDVWGYWVNRNGEAMPNWGTPTGTRGCECSLDQSCDDAEHQTCNCDANDEEWRKDDGDVTDKATLPVTELRFGDTGSDKEKVVYKVGPLKCWGMEQPPFESCDDVLAAEFNGEGDYLIRQSDGSFAVQKCNELYLTYPPPVLRSCEELRLVGYIQSGEYLIDPDFFNAGHRPFTVFCDMMTGTTIVNHDQQGPQLSKGFNDKGEHHVIVHYGNGAEINQVAGLVDASENCEQYISAECHDSHIFSGHRTMSVYTWWNSRNGTKMTNWGTPTGVQGCVCSLTESCDIKRNLCNCDTNDDRWRKDDGILNDKDTLPVSQLRIGDTGGSDEVALYALGALKCTGIGAKVYTTCAALQEGGIVGGGHFLVDPDGIDGGTLPSAVMCEGATQIATKTVNCPNVTRIVPQYVTVMTGNNKPMVTPKSGSDGQCPKTCIDKNRKPVQTNNNKANLYAGQTGGSGTVSAASLNFIIFGVVVLLIIVIIVLVIVSLQWRRVKRIQQFGSFPPDTAVECSNPGETNRASVDSFSNIHFSNGASAQKGGNDYNLLGNK